MATTTADVLIDTIHDWALKFVIVTSIHNAAIALATHEVSDGQDKDVKTAASKALVLFKEHLKMAKMMKAH